MDFYLENVSGGKNNEEWKIKCMVEYKIFVGKFKRCCAWFYYKLMKFDMLLKEAWQ